MDTDNIDFDYSLWDRYLMECRILSEETQTVVRPSLSDFAVWKQELEIDEDEL